MSRPSGWAVLVCGAACVLALAGWRAQAAGQGAADTVAPAQEAADTVQAAAVQDTVSPASAGAVAQAARRSLDTSWWQRVRSVLGMVFMVLVAWILSSNRRLFPWRIVWWGTALQVVFALLILRTAPGERFFALINDIILQLLAYTQDGASFIFGGLVYNNVPVGIPGAGPPAMAPLAETSGQWAAVGSFFAFTVLPTIIFFSSLMAVLYYLRVMQAVVKGMAWVMQRTMGTSGAETLSTSGNVFLGQTEAPLMIRPFVEGMTMSELNLVMVGGFANVAGGVLVAYVGMLYTYFPDIAGHLLAVSVMSAPASIVIAKVMVPEEGEPETAGTLKADVPSVDVNIIDAAARGAGEGLTLALNVGAMLLAFIALIAVFNALLGWAGGLFGFDALSLELVLGWVLAPVAWIMGVSWSDATVVGSLLGVKTVINEFVAYLMLADLLQGGSPLDPRSVIIASYALCGFANFSSIAIQIGGIGGIAPSRRSDLSRLGLRAMIGGTLATFMSATVAGAIL